MNCETEIPASFKLAIQRGECPACGDSLYTESVKELLAELSSAMERMPNDPQGLAGWLISNYKLVKIGSAEPVSEFYGDKKQKQPSQSNNESGLKIANSPVQEFMKRTGVKPKTPEELAEVYRKITEAREGEISEPSQEEYSDDDPEVQAIAATMRGPVTKKQMQQFKQAQISSEFDNEDDRHPAIQQERLKRLQKQNELAGGSVGKINRSS